MSGIEVKVLTLCIHINHQIQPEVKTNRFSRLFPEMEANSRWDSAVSCQWQTFLAVGIMITLVLKVDLDWVAHLLL